MLSGSVKLAKPVTKSAIGLIIDPTSEILDCFSMIKVINDKPHAKNIRDSYKLLNGKYPKLNQRSPSSAINKIFTKILP